MNPFLAGAVLLLLALAQEWAVAQWWTRRKVRVDVQAAVAAAELRLAVRLRADLAADLTAVKDELTATVTKLRTTVRDDVGAIESAIQRSIATLRDELMVEPEESTPEEIPRAVLRNGVDPTEAARKRWDTDADQARTELNILATLAERVGEHKAKLAWDMFIPKNVKRSLLRAGDNYGYILEPLLARLQKHEKFVNNDAAKEPLRYE